MFVKLRKLVAAYKGVICYTVLTNLAFGVRTKLVHEFTKCTEELDCLIWCVHGEDTMHGVNKCDLTLGENGSSASLGTQCIVSFLCIHTEIISIICFLGTCHTLL